MRLNRRFALLSGGGSFAIPTFSGSHAIFGDKSQGYIELYSAGNLIFKKDCFVDVFVIGSGLAGLGGIGKGGAGTLGVSQKGVEVTAGSYAVTVGATCSSTSARNTSTAIGITSSKAGSSGGAAASGNSGTNGQPGTDGTSIPFAVTSGDFHRKYGAGGGGGGRNATGAHLQGGAGGTLGGGAGSIYNGNPGTANTGSGGGGGANGYTGGAGGSGIVIIRWGYGDFEIPRFSGNHAVFGTAEKGYIECYSSGTLTFKQGGEVDLFLLGSGLSGANGTATNTGSSSTGSGTSYGGKGGSGAVGKTILGYKANKGSYPVTIGETCYSTTEPNATTAFGQTANTVANNGGNGSYTYAEWGTGDSSKNTSTSGTKGSNGTSFPFGESALNADVDPSSIWYKKQLGAGGGGGGARSAGWKYAGGYAGGTYGGGYGGKYSDGVQIDCTPGEANTGAGGGGGGSAAYGDAIYQFEGKPGGSGILIVRWGDWTA